MCAQRLTRRARNRGASDIIRGAKLKKKLIITLVLLAAFVAALIGGCYLLYSHYQEETVFLDKTTLNGESIGGKTPGEVADELAAFYNTAQTHVMIREKGETSIEGTLEDFGYECDRASFEKMLTQSYREQRTGFFNLLGNLFGGFEITSEEVYTFDESVLLDLVQSKNLAEERVETLDPYTEFDEETQSWHVVEGYEGNMINDEKFQDLVYTTLDGIVSAGNLPKRVTIDITDDLYTSVPPVDNVPELQKWCDEENLKLRKQEALDAYKEAVITYTFGNETQVLDYETIGQWLTVDDSLTVTIDQAAIESYVTSLSAKYNTQYDERTFQTTTGKTVTFPEGENEYGYRINYKEECAQLRADIEGKTAVTREPVYYRTNDYGNPLFYQRNGVDDICGTYVEVNLTKQHMWFYINGQLIVESDIVSGCVADKKETQTGVFPLAFKQSPRTLIGDEAHGSGGYETEVQYWMPFYDGQGLHDADWRGSFGGNIYRKDGSHGCVNLPPAIAKQLYEKIEVGMPIFIYKEPKS